MDSTVAEDNLPTNRDSISHTSVHPSCQKDVMLATSPSADIPHMASQSKECLVDRMMIIDDISNGYDRLFDASGSQFILNVFHLINSQSLQVFTRIGLHITLFEQPVTSHCKIGNFSCGPTAHTIAMSGAAA